MNSRKERMKAVRRYLAWKSIHDGTKQYSIQLIDHDTGDIIESCVDSLIFDSKSEADDYVSERNFCTLDDPLIEEIINSGDYGTCEGLEYIVVEN